MVESQLRNEANAQHQALTVKRQAMKEEIATDFVAIVQQEVQSHIDGSRLPRLERQVRANHPPAGDLAGFESAKSLEIASAMGSATCRSSAISVALWISATMHRVT